MIELLINDFAAGVARFNRTILIHRFQRVRREAVVTVARGTFARRLAAAIARVLMLKQNTTQHKWLLLQFGKDYFSLTCFLFFKQASKCLCFLSVADWLAYLKRPKRKNRDWLSLVGDSMTRPGFWCPRCQLFRFRFWITVLLCLLLFRALFG